MSHRFAAALAAVALVAGGAGTALANDGHHGDENDNAKVLKSDLFGSKIDGPVFFGVKPGGAPWVLAKGEAEVRRDGSINGPPRPSGRLGARVRDELVGL